MLLNKRPLNSTPLNAVGVTALVVVADPAIATASCVTNEVLYSTITITPDPAICTAIAPDPNAGLGFFPSIDVGYGEGTGDDLITPHVGFTLPPAAITYGEGEGDDEIIPHIGLSFQQETQAYGEGEGQVGRIIFGVVAEVTTGVGGGAGTDLITPKIGVTLGPPVSQEVAGEGQEIGTTLDDVVLRLQIIDTASCTIYDTFSATLVIDTDPAYAYASTHDPVVFYSSAVLNLKVESYALAYPYYGNPTLGTITIPPLVAFAEASVSSYVIVTDPASDTVDLPPIQAIAYGQAGVYAVNDDITYRPAPAIATASAPDPLVHYGNLTPIVEPAVATALFSGETVFTDTVVANTSAIATAYAPDPVVRFTTATVPKVSVLAEASTHDPVVLLGSITPHPFFVRIEDRAYAYTGPVHQWTIMLPPIQAAATAYTSEPTVIFSSATVTAKATATAIVNNPTVEIEEVEHTTITPPPAIAVASFTGIAISEAVTVDLTGSMVPGVCLIGDHVVLLGTLSLGNLSVEADASLDYNRDLMEDELFKEHREPPFYQVILDKNSSGYNILEGGQSNMPEVNKIKVVKHITDDLLELQRMGNVRIRGLVDLSNRLSYAMIDLTSAVTDGTVGAVTDFASINKAVSELAQQQNDILRDIAELVEFIESAQERTAYLIGRMDDSIGNAVLPSDLSGNMEVTVLIQDKRF